MKEIKAYMHANRIGDVIAALEESGLVRVGAAAGVRNFNVTAVQGLLKPIDGAEERYSMTLGEAVIDEVRLECLCEDDQVMAMAEIIGRHARTGQAIAGWITVTEVILAVPIGGTRA
ncbi:MAG: P-II family nitrogen regulator [Burkholderiales bacterium]|nr:P-II family nitrogen regulator [Burkholderiales bacterium]